MHKRVAIGLAALVASALPVLAQARIERIDARSVAGRLLSISASKVVVESEGRTTSLATEDVAEVRLAASAEPLKVQGQIVLSAPGGLLLASKSLAMRDGKISAVSELTGPLTLDLSAVGEVLLPTARQTPAQVREQIAGMDLPTAARDRLIVERSEQSWVSVEGVVQEIGETEITFEWKGAQRKVDRKTVRAIHLAGVAVPKAVRGMLVGREGSTMPFAKIDLEGDKMAADLMGAGVATIELASVAAVRFASDRVQNLSTLKPAKVVEKGYFDQVFAYQADRCAGGGALRLGGQEYAQGLGLHSRCELTWTLEGPFRRLVALVGIDDSVRPAGDAELTVLGDGKPLGQPLRLTGKDQPSTLEVDVAGVKELVIRVDFGADKVDAGDCVDLVGVRLIR